MVVKLSVTSPGYPIWLYETPSFSEGTPILLCGDPYSALRRSLSCSEGTLEQFHPKSPV